MGQAKKRGTFEERKQQAVEKNKLVNRLVLNWWKRLLSYKPSKGNQDESGR